MTNDERIQAEKGARLAEARIAAGFKSARDAAISNRWPESTYRAHEKGTRTIGQDDAERYAKRFRARGAKVSAQYIMFGNPDDAPEPPSVGSSVKVVGRVGAGAEIEPDFEQIPEDGLFEISLPFPVPDDTIAFEVEGESMWPRYDSGDVIVCSKTGSSVEAVLGWEAAVRTGEGHRYLKRVQNGSAPGFFTLESHNAKPIRDVRISWASEVQHVVRSGQWRRLKKLPRQKSKA